MPQQIRGVALISLTGVRAIELQADYDTPIQLRVFSEAGVDQGALSLRDYDPNSNPTAGNGYLFHLFDRPGGSLLATGTAQQLGQRAGATLSTGANPTPGVDSVTITYPDRSDESVAPVTVSETYTFTASPAPSANNVAVGASHTLSIDNLVSAINGSFDYGAPEVGHGTQPCKELVAYRDTATTMVLEARDGGTWGNAVTVTVSLGSWDSATLVGGTGNAGINMHFDAVDLPASLIPAPDITRHAYCEVYGLTATDEPVKLVTCPALLHASGVVLP